MKGYLNDEPVDERGYLSYLENVLSRGKRLVDVATDAHNLWTVASKIVDMVLLHPRGIFTLSLSDICWLVVYWVLRRNFRLMAWVTGKSIWAIKERFRNYRKKLGITERTPQKL